MLQVLILAPATMSEIQVSTYTIVFRLVGMPLVKCLQRFWSPLEGLGGFILKEFLN